MLIGLGVHRDYIEVLICIYIFQWQNAPSLEDEKSGILYFLNAER